MTTGKSKATDGALDAAGLEAAVKALAEHGIDIRMPSECDLDDLEQERFEAICEAISAYLAALPPPTGEPVAWRVASANYPDEYFGHPAEADMWANSPGLLDSVVTPLSQVEPATWREFDHETIDYVLRYGGRCRDCADHHGLCPSGLPCDVDDAKTAIRWVLKALNYGIVNGFVPSPRPSQSAELLSLRRKVEETEAAWRVILRPTDRTDDELAFTFVRKSEFDAFVAEQSKRKIADSGWQITDIHEFQASTAESAARALAGDRP